MLPSLTAARVKADTMIQAAAKMSCGVRDATASGVRRWIDCIGGNDRSLIKTGVWWIEP